MATLRSAAHVETDWGVVRDEMGAVAVAGASLFLTSNFFKF
jgi:hypothetical protein